MKDFLGLLFNSVKTNPNIYMKKVLRFLQIIIYVLLIAYLSSLLLSCTGTAHTCFSYKDYPYTGLYKKGVKGRGNQDVKSHVR